MNECMNARTSVKGEGIIKERCAVFYLIPALSSQIFIYGIIMLNNW